MTRTGDAAGIPGWSTAPRCRASRSSGQQDFDKDAKHHEAEDPQGHRQAHQGHRRRKLRREQANRRHLLEGKPSTRTRRLKGTTDVAKADEKRIKRLLGKA